MSRRSLTSRIGLPIAAFTLALLQASSQPAWAQEPPSPEPPPSETETTTQPSPAMLGRGIALMLLGSGAAVGAVSYAVGRDSHEDPLLVVEGDSGLSGGDLAIITGVGLFGAGLGVALTVFAVDSASPTAEPAPAEASLLLGPAGVGLSVTF